MSKSENNFKEIKPGKIKDNVFKLIGADWMLVTAGNIGSVNTMTASWGGLGVLWEKNICTCFIRPVRHTYNFIEKNNFFTLSFFTEEYKDVLNYCGSHSGRDGDKIIKTGLTPVGGTDYVYFHEARLVIIAKKIYFQDILPQHFLESDIASFYPRKDYHRMYIGEIIKVLTR